MTLVDLSEDVLARSEQRIQDSIRRVARKLHKEDAEAGDQFVAASLDKLQYVTDAGEGVNELLR